MPGMTKKMPSTTIALAWRATTNQAEGNWTQSAAVRRGVNTSSFRLRADAGSSLPPRRRRLAHRVGAVRGAVD
eukprot:2592350-Pleurochrysis_carterae.AAC.1